MSLPSRDEIVSLADAVRHTRVFDPTTDKYIAGFAGEPIGKWFYQDHAEPVLTVDGFDNPSACNAWLTVNRYNAVVLNSRNMLIADVDFGDERLNRFAGANDASDVIDALNNLNKLDKHLCDGAVFSTHSYRVYRTHSGCRVICTSREFWRGGLDHFQEYWADSFMRFLKGDPNYIALCQKQSCYRARLTPKPWREQEEPQVCWLVESVGNGEVHVNLADQLALHDEMTLFDQYADESVSTW